MQNAMLANRGLTSTGAVAATGILFVATGQQPGGGIQLSGIFVGTVQFEQSLDGGTTWIAKKVYPFGGGAGVTSATAVGQWKFPTGGASHFRARCSAFTSGTIQADIVLTEGLDTSAAPSTADMAALIALFPAALAANGGLKVTPLDALGAQVADYSAAVKVNGDTSAAPSLTAVASSASTAQMLAANGSRKGLIAVNTDANPVYLKYGITASLTDFSVLIAGNGGYWEMPWPIYTGRIDALWAADGIGSLYLTES